MSWFITRGVDRKTRHEIARIRKALERIADVAELNFGSRGGPSFRSFYTDKSPKAVDEAALLYVDDEEAWANEQAEESGISLEDFREKMRYTHGETEGEEQDGDVKL